MRRMIEARRGVIFSIAAALSICPLVSWAQNFPTKVVRSQVIKDARIAQQ